MRLVKVKWGKLSLDIPFELLLKLLTKVVDHFL
jgi:hypothetical protein